MIPPSWNKSREECYRHGRDQLGLCASLPSFYTYRDRHKEQVLINNIHRCIVLKGQLGRKERAAATAAAAAAAVNAIVNTPMLMQDEEKKAFKSHCYALRLFRAPCNVCLPACLPV